jgi:hypothetical protein
MCMSASMYDFMYVYAWFYVSACVCLFIFDWFLLTA